MIFWRIEFMTIYASGRVHSSKENSTIWCCSREHNRHSHHHQTFLSIERHQFHSLLCYCQSSSFIDGCTQCTAIFVRYWQLVYSVLRRTEYGNHLVVDLNIFFNRTLYCSFEWILIHIYSWFVDVPIPRIVRNRWWLLLVGTHGILA